MWREYFNQKAVLHQGSVQSSDYFSEKSFLDQRRSLLEWIGPLHGARILDAGCGVGAVSEGLAASNLVVGVDLAEAALKYAHGRGLAAICADLTRLPLAPGLFDLVLSVGVLQLVDDDQAVLESLYSRVKPGGTLLIETLNQRSLQRKAFALLAQEPRTFRLFDPNELRDRFERLGLRDLSLLHFYYPFTSTTRAARSSLWSRHLSTSFAIRGRRPT